MTFKFDINQRVKIKELELAGTVKNILVSERGSQYSVRYFWNSECKEVYFFEDEIDVI